MRAALVVVTLLSLALLSVPTSSTLDFPLGLARVLDLGFLEAPGGRGLVIASTLAGALLLVRGGARRWLALGLLLLLLPQGLLATAWNSQGFTHHGHQIVTLALLGAMMMLIVDDDGDEASVLFGAQLLIASCYLTAAVAKVAGGPGFIADAPLLAVDVVKTARQQWGEALVDDGRIDAAHHLASWLLAHPQAVRVFAVVTVVLEASVWLGVGSFGRGAVGGVLLVLMHRTILLTLGLSFPLWELLVIACFVRPVAAIHALRDRRRRPRVGSSLQ